MHCNKTNHGQMFGRRYRASELNYKIEYYCAACIQETEEALELANKKLTENKGNGRYPVNYSEISGESHTVELAMDILSNALTTEAANEILPKIKANMQNQKES